MATDTYTLNAGQVTRMRAAVGKAMGLPGDATVQQAHDFWILQMKEFVKAQERRINEKAALAAVTDAAFDIT